MKKKILSLLLVAVMACSAVACASAEPQDKNTETTTQGVDNKGTWSSDFSMDEFGDVTYNSEIFLRGNISGDFSNTATISSELGGFVFIQKNSQTQHYEVAFRLFEYKDTLATYSSSDEIVLKTKVGNDKSAYTLIGTAPNGDVTFDTSEDEKAGDYFFNTLYNGEDIRCIITIGNSQYNFTIESDNLVEACEEAENKANEQAEANAIHSVEEVLKAFYNMEKPTERYQYLKDNMGEFPLLTTEEINEILKNYCLSISVYEPGILSEFETRLIYEYKEDGSRKELGMYDMTDKKFRSTGIPAGDYAVEDDELRLISQDENGDDVKAYQFRKLADANYLLVQTKGIDKNEPEMYIYVQYNEDGKPQYIQ